MGPINGRHVLFGLLGFFGVMFAVNGVFVYVATTTFSGTSTEDAYVRGLRYNESIETHRAIEATGWRHAATIEGSQVVLTVRQADGRPVSRLVIEGRIGRPATQALDLGITFDADGDGRYVAETGGLAHGQWQLSATVHPGAGYSLPTYEMTTRLWSKP